jgi:hypothetical protein
MFLAIIGTVACGKERDNAAPGSSPGSPPPPGSAEPATAAVTRTSSSETAASGSAAATRPEAAATPPPATPPATKTCSVGDAAACVAEARAIAPTGAFRANLPPAEADAKVAATVELAARACELGAGEGCALQAQYGKFADSDKNLERACELGYVPSCGSVGSRLVDGGKAADRARAAELLEKACEAGAFDWRSATAHPGGFCHHLYELYKGPMKDEARAATALERACAQGDKRDCPCKSDGDCGEMPDDMSGEFFCSSDGACGVSGG